MLMVSISRTDAAPSATATARRRMMGASRSRWAADRVLESRTPGIRCAPGRMITAAATTAPHVGATPTSSIPTTRIAPSRQWLRSKRRVGTRDTMVAVRVPRAPPGSGLGARSALAQRRGLADALAQEVQLGAPHATVADDLDLLDPRAVHHERALHADAARDLPDGDRAGDAATL